MLNKYCRLRRRSEEIYPPSHGKQHRAQQLTKRETEDEEQVIGQLLVGRSLEVREERVKGRDNQGFQKPADSPTAKVHKPTGFSRCLLLCTNLMQSRGMRELPSS
jgi:hypothetical protein